MSRNTTAIKNKQRSCLVGHSPQLAIGLHKKVAVKSQFLIPMISELTFCLFIFWVPRVLEMRYKHEQLTHLIVQNYVQKCNAFMTLLCRLIPPLSLKNKPSILFQTSRSCQPSKMLKPTSCGASAWPGLQDCVAKTQKVSI